jgi:hypothetical protein
MELVELFQMLLKDVFIRILRERDDCTCPISPLINATLDLALSISSHLHISNILTAVRIRANATFGNGL